MKVSGGRGHPLGPFVPLYVDPRDGETCFNWNLSHSTEEEEHEMAKSNSTFNVYCVENRGQVA